MKKTLLPELHTRSGAVHTGVPHEAQNHVIFSALFVILQDLIGLRDADVSGITHTVVTVGVKFT